MFDGSACWQYVIRRKEERAVPRKFEETKAADTRVEQISLAYARRFIERYEWLGNVGSAQICFGLFNESHLLAVSCYTKAVAPDGFSRLLSGVHARDIYQLCRGATAPHSPKWAASRVIGRSLRLLHQQTGSMYVFAYADPRAGEVGIVYQAANAIYLGLTDARGPGEYIVNGERLHPRTVFRRFGSARHKVLSEIDPSYTRVQRVKKHRYVFVLGCGARRRHALERLSCLRKAAPRRNAESLIIQ